MTLGEKIKACRQAAGMSQEKVAELVGVSRQAVTKWEANQSAPNTENLFKLAEILVQRSTFCSLPGKLKTPRQNKFTSSTNWRKKRKQKPAGTNCGQTCSLPWPLLVDTFSSI